MANTQDFHRKYRPKNLLEYIGNKRIVEATLSFLPSERKPQVVLLQGHSGCGKTTFARLLCSCYCCEHPLLTGDACGECDTCKEFQHYIETGDTSGLMNIKEVDSAIINGKDDIETLIAEMTAPLFDGMWRCFIFDECHRLSQQAQSTLLKTIEEPPENVLICLCTTDPDKMLDTIISRCQYKFEVVKPQRKEMVDLLEKVCEQEGIKCDRRALSLVATAGELVPRNSLIELQRVYRECGEVTYDKTTTILNVIADKYYFTFYELLTAEKVNTYKYVMFLNTIKDKMELSTFMEGLIAFTLRGIYILNGVSVDGLDAAELKPYATLFAKFTLDEIVHMLTFLTELRNKANLEMQLMLLGYTGLRKTAPTAPMATADSSDELLSLNDMKTTAESDKSAGTTAFIEKTEITEEAKQEMIKKHTAVVDPKDLGALFGAVRVDMRSANKGGSENK